MARMPQPFFPNNVALAWTFYVAVLGIALVATVTDLRKLVIPKWLTLPALALGIVFNIVLGIWTDGPRGNFLIGGEGGWLGGLDGLLFALAGFAVGFALFFVMWILGTCNGGDLKLFAAIGAWLGPVVTIELLAGTIFFVIILAFVRLVYGAFFKGMKRTVKDYSLAGAAKPAKRRTLGGTADDPHTRRRLMAYSLAVALTVALLGFWLVYKDFYRPRNLGNVELTQARARL
jgi:prepilin peptidase CpaA